MASTSGPEGQTFYHESAIQDLREEADRILRAVAEGRIMPGTERAFLNENELGQLDAGDESMLGIAMERQYASIEARKNNE